MSSKKREIPGYLRELYSVYFYALEDLKQIDSMQNEK